MADIIGEVKDQQEIREWMSRTKQNFYKYFLPSDQVRLAASEESLFYDYDLVKKDWVRKKTVGSFIPIYAGQISPEDVINAFVSWTQHAAAFAFEHTGETRSSSYVNMEALPQAADTIHVSKMQYTSVTHY